MKKIIINTHTGNFSINHIIRDSEFAVPGIYSNEYQIHFIIRGFRNFYYRRTGCKMIDGSITFIDKKKIPDTNVIGGNLHERILIECREQWFHKIAEAMGCDFCAIFSRLHGVHVLGSEDVSKVLNIFRRIEFLLSGADISPEEKALSETLVAELILDVSMMKFSESETFTMPESRMTRYLKVRKISKYVSSHAASLNGLDDVASIYNIDKTYLARIFKEVTNYTVVDFINHCRVDNAKTLLVETELSIPEVAERTGYSSASYFSQVFKRLAGESPLKYRISNSSKSI